MSATFEAEAAIVPPGGKPPLMIATDFPEQRTCIIHPNRELNEQEIAKGYRRCQECREREAVLGEARASTDSTAGSSGSKNLSLLKRVTVKVRSLFAGSAESARNR
ncbi:hypothetical protein EK21DRAFT_116352 [Setomelanomma holmii]|uniref:Uncharacterized protein n=1 Tax=Setomelanomma holmii TaxID=210430 RepID=A0A9P4H1I2_9PLEO|nr:hypothetical protein EK21DRAFT_116352 [Setomelanomma holmii]